MSSKSCKNRSLTGALLTAAVNLSKLRQMSFYEVVQRKTRESVFGDKPEMED